MERPYFGKDLSQILNPPNDDQGVRISGNWADLGTQCCTLASFLNNETGGLFLVAGPRGIGKTSLVRHMLHKWRKNGVNHVKNRLN